MCQRHDTAGNRFSCRQRQQESSRSASNRLIMRDRSSSYWFQVGDTVQVVASDVEKNGINLQHRVGTVMETWEKCDVDPTCCCAEQVDPNMAVRVEFIDGTLLVRSDDDDASTTTSSSSSSSSSSTFNHYFAESELEKVIPTVVDDDQAIPSIASAAAFDGKSCVAFKLDQLKMGQQAQRLAKFEASRRQGENGNNVEETS